MVTWPWWLRPPLLESGSSRDFSGVSRVSSSLSRVDRNRVPGVTGLNFLIPIVVSLGSADFVELDVVALGERHHGLLVSLPVTHAWLPGDPAHQRTAGLPRIVHGAHVGHRH